MTRLIFQLSDRLSFSSRLGFLKLCMCYNVDDGTEKKDAVLQNVDENWGNKKKVVGLCVGDEHQYVCMYSCRQIERNQVHPYFWIIFHLFNPLEEIFQFCSYFFFLLLLPSQIATAFLNVDNQSNWNWAFLSHSILFYNMNFFSVQF